MMDALRAFYNSVLDEPIPDAWLVLLAMLDEADG